MKLLSTISYVNKPSVNFPIIPNYQNFLAFSQLVGVVVIERVEEWGLNEKINRFLKLHEPDCVPVRKIEDLVG